MKDYWQEYWNKNDIISSENPQLKIGRSIHHKPISKELWIETLNFIETQLQLTDRDNVLDIGAGSGMISLPFAEKASQVVALDFSEKLLQNIKHPKITTICEDARKVVFKDEEFSKIIFYFALQHFSLEDSIILFKKMYNCLQKNGIAYIGDIPDLNKLFLFHHSETYKNAYFKSLEENKPILGTWFTQEFLLNLAYYAGFSHAEIIEQPNHFINAHYRFDIKIIK
jgi:cyclopropane fatty-acyl-phospholipid synthase-like methyltransferase